MCEEKGIFRKVNTKLGRIEMASTVCNSRHSSLCVSVYEMSTDRNLVRSLRHISVMFSGYNWNDFVNNMIGIVRRCKIWVKAGKKNCPPFTIIWLFGDFLFLYLGRSILHPHPLSDQFQNFDWYWSTLGIHPASRRYVLWKLNGDVSLVVITLAEKHHVTNTHIFVNYMTSISCLCQKGNGTCRQVNNFQLKSNIEFTSATFCKWIFSVSAQ